MSMDMRNYEPFMMYNQETGTASPSPGALQFIGQNTAIPTVPQTGGGTQSLFEYVTDVNGSATTTSHTIYVADNTSGTYQIVAVAARFTTASTSGTLQVEVAGAGVAIGSGTNQLTGAVSLSGTANTTANGTVIASPTTVAAGTSINVIFAGTMTGLAGMSITVVMKKIT